MKQRTTQTLFDYWDSVRAGRIAPRRLEIDPSRIAAILAETFMLERDAAEDFIFRLAGTRLCELFGYELRGTSLLAGWSGADRAIVDRTLSAICSEGAVAHLTIEAGIDARRHVELDVVLLPLLHGGSGIGRIIGAMSPVLQPHWLDKGRLTSRRLLRHELVRLDRRDGNHSELPTGRQTPFLPALSASRVVRTERRQFRVLDGGLANAKHGKS